MIQEDIYRWDEIVDDFNGSDLLLGNGFSINFSNEFSYTSLFQNFLEEIEPNERELFESFDTTNFELIQRDFKNAIEVNAKFDIDSHDIIESYDTLKDGLITTIAQTHPSFDDVDNEEIERTSRIILKNFKDIYTTNYDALLYHIILKIKDWSDEDDRIKGYSDYFWGNNDYDNFNYNSFTGFQDYDYNLIYYLHGALFIFKKHHYTLKRLRRGDDRELIDLISNAITEDNIPLFVSEGTYYDKMNAINSNGYLSFCYNKLHDNSGNIVVHGFGFGDNDKHIIEALKRRFFKVAIGIYTGDKDDDAINEELANIKAKLPNSNIVFFDSQSLF